MSGNILIIEDEEIQQMMISSLLNKLGYQTVQAFSGKQAFSVLEKKNRDWVDLALLDLQMPEMDGLEVLEILKQKYPDLPVIMLTGSVDVQDVVNAMRLGATDFINKPPDREHLDISIKNAIKIRNLSDEVARLKRKENGATVFSDLIGYNEGLSQIVTMSNKAAKTNIPVMINGETGVGKELFARAIHGESDRVAAPFIAVNCGAIPNQLAESILFGHEKGAFTGATEKTIGKFREANGGTIFLDEVGELPLELQVKLLRTLQEKEIEPVGAGKTVPVDVRIISATNRNLQEEIEQGNFREDLYFRLNVFHLDIPPLRERALDIIPLAHHFIKSFSASENLAYMELTKRAEEFLMARNWSGNVRELENTIHRAMVICDSDKLDIDDFSYALSHMNDADEINIGGSSSYNISAISNNGELKSAEQIEKEAIEIALVHHDNNVTQAAKSLKMAKSTFYKKVKN